MSTSLQEDCGFSDVSSVGETAGWTGGWSCNRSKWIGREAILKRNAQQQQQKEEQRKAAEAAKAEAEAKAEEAWRAWQARAAEESEGSGLEDSEDDFGDRVGSVSQANSSTAAQDEGCPKARNQVAPAEDPSDGCEQPKLAAVDVVVGIFQEHDSACDGTIDHMELVLLLQEIGMTRALAERVVESVQQNGRVKYADFVGKMFTARHALPTSVS